jgi:hypothetical protein
MSDETYLRVYYALDQDKTPSHDQGLNRIRERMRLIRPGNVGRGNEKNSDAPVARRRDELVESPVLEDEAGEEHQDPERPEDGDGRDFAILPVADPQPPKQEHRKAVDGP